MKASAIETGKHLIHCEHYFPFKMNEISEMEAVSLPDWNFALNSVEMKSGPEGNNNHKAIEPAGFPGSQNVLPPAPNSFEEALGFLIELYRAFGSNVASEELNKLINAFSNKVIQMHAKTASESKESLLKIDAFSCSICFEVVNEPLTLRCGHSYCRKCLRKEVIGNQCRMCNYRFTSADSMHTRPNVLLMSLVEKLWPNNTKVASLRQEGNELFQQQKQHEALAKYSEAIALNPQDHLSLCNRAHALFAMGDSCKALKDSEDAIKYCPFWFKSYFRKAVTLISLGSYEDAFSTLSLCIYLIKVAKIPDESAINPVKAEMSKILHKILQCSTSFVQPSVRRRTLEQPLFSPYPKIFSRSDRQWSSCNWIEPDCSSGDEGDVIMKDGLVDRSRRSGSFVDSSQQNKRNKEFVGNLDQTISRVHRLFSRSAHEITAFEKLTQSSPRSIDEALLTSSDFECSLCYRLLFQPVTTTCGHTYCRSCLERCLDHSPTCPLCKTSLENCLTYRKLDITHVLEFAISKFLPKDYADRVSQHLEELADGDASGKSKEIEMPIFVCTMAFPTVPCALHVFEPRYRLMIRRCMESGSKRFGMCCYLQEGDHNYGDFGTLLEVRNVQYFPDGRSVIDTVGVRRFKVLKKSMKDGYNMATIEFLQDKVIEEAESKRLKESHETVFKEASEWLQSINQVLRQRIYTHFGTMPVPEEDWMTVSEGPSWTWWLLAILPLDAKAQLAILSMNSLQKRLESLHKVLSYVKSRLTETCS